MAKITIFGLAGTGKSSVAKQLAKILEAEYLSPGNLFREKAMELGLTLKEFTILSEKESHYNIELDNQIAQFGKSHEHFVVESRLPWYFIPDSLKIKLSCDHDERIRRVSARDNISIEDAESQSTFREKVHITLYKNLYNIEDYTDVTHFDHIIDTTHISVDEVVSKIQTFVV